jgi:hypothetical protein
VLTRQRDLRTRRAAFQAAAWEGDGDRKINRARSQIERAAAWKAARQKRLDLQPMKKPQYFITAIAGILAALLIGCGRDLPLSPPSDGGEKLSVPLLDLAGRHIDPFQTTNAETLVFIFVSIDCPISNRYAPEVRRLHDQFAGRGVKFWLVYPNRDDSVEVIRKHIEDYQYPLAALRDPEHSLVKKAKVRVTPEVAVYSRTGTKLYQGRIDDRYVDFGKERPQATQRDLQDALVAIVNGKAVTNAVTTAVGCYIPESP